MIGQLVGNYRVLRLLGQGGMGQVFEAVHEQIKRRAAIKVLHEDFSRDADVVRRFFNEALAVNVIQHPSIVGVFESGQLSTGAAFIVMEFLDGMTLSSHLKKEGIFAEKDALLLVRQIASALAAAHAKDIVHREVYKIDRDCLRYALKSLQRRRQDHDSLQRRHKPHIPTRQSRQ